MARPSRILLSALILVLIGCAACRAPGDGRRTARGPLRIAVIPMGTTHEFWKSVHAGALTAAREMGVEIVWKGPLKEDDRNKQIQVVETLAGAGVDAVFTPNESTTFGALRALQDHGLAGTAFVKGEKNP